MSSTPHDALFKHTFSQPQHAIELLRSVLPPAVVRHIDFDTLQVEPTSFIDEKLRARFSDLLFRVHLAGQPAYLYLLFEHQSGPERLMCLRLLRYVLDIARALSAVPMTTLWAFRPVRRNRDVIPVLRKSLDLLVEVVRAPNGLAALAVLLRYILEVSDSSPGDVQELLHQFMLPEASETVMTAAERLREEGREEARQQTQRDNVLMLLNQRFGALPESLLARIRRADFAQLQHWFRRGLTAQRLDDVFADE